jgi:RNA polymerase sigma-70 factor (ECF subfamily)
MRRDEKHIDIERIAEGDHGTFRRMFIQYYPKLKSFINRLVKSEEVAEDLSQDIFEYIWVNRKDLSDLKSLEGYLFGIARNKACNYLTHKTVEEDYISSCTAGLAGYMPDEEIQAKELELLIRMTVEQMPEQRRRVFVMSRVENLKNAEIAEKLNIFKKTVENHLNHALNRIREVIALALIFFF